jgi:hypothetical protein
MIMIVPISVSISSMPIITKITFLSGKLRVLAFFFMSGGLPGVGLMTVPSAKSIS